MRTHPHSAPAARTQIYFLRRSVLPKSLEKISVVWAAWMPDRSEIKFTPVEPSASEQIQFFKRRLGYCVDEFFPRQCRKGICHFQLNFSEQKCPYPFPLLISLGLLIVSGFSKCFSQLSLTLIASRLSSLSVRRSSQCNYPIIEG